MTEKPSLDLVAQLREDLSVYHYTEFQVTDIPGVGRLHQIITPRRWMARYACVVLEVADSAQNTSQCKEILEQIRGFFSRQMAGSWWKDGTFAVLLCSHRLYEHLKSTGANFTDLTGWHANVILGTVFVDRDQFASSAVSTWGLWYAGKHFVAIKRAVQEWCAENLRQSAPQSG